MIGGAAIRYPKQSMYLRLPRLLAALGAVFILAALTPPSSAQQAGAGLAAADLEAEPSNALPDAPTPQFAVAAADPAAEQSQPGQEQSSQSQTPASTQQSSSSQGQQPTAGDDQKLSPEEQRKKAQEQLKQQEHQRVMGVMATFNTTRNQNALPLSPGQKFQLFFKSASDPWPFLLAGVVGGIGQAYDDEPEWGYGAQGYAKRFGAAYSDYFIGNFFGNAVLPSLLHEDPRYFQKGKGRFSTRFLWAAASTVWCKRDKGGWGPNYANIAGNFIGTAIARAYYPSTERTVADTIDDGLTVSAEGIVGAEVIEFWPDMVRQHRRKQAEKLAREEAKKQAQSGGQPATTPAPDKPQQPAPDKPQE